MMPTGDEMRTDLADKRTDLANTRTVLAAERNEFAAQRTFSAWVRTGLAGVGGGLALIKVVLFNDPDKIVLAQFAGGILILWGISVNIYALFSYRRYALRSKFKYDKFDLAAMMSIGLVALFLSFAILIISLF
jgi:putative membrane protein